MSSLADDRTAKARIRDEALRLFGEHGPDAVRIRDVAAAAGVSPALVMQHYGSRTGLQDAVDEHVTAQLEAVLGEVTAAAAARFGEPAVTTATDLLAARFADHPTIGPYLGRSLVATGTAGAALFRRLYDVGVAALAEMTAAGAVDAGPDPAVRAAFLLVNDLAVLILRERLREVLDVDPLSADGMRRWAAEVTSVYRYGLAAGTGEAAGPAGRGRS